MWITMIAKYEGSIDDQEALRAYLVKVMDYISYLKDRYAL